MYFSRARLRPNATSSREFWKIVTGPYQIHSMIWDLFADSENRARDFLFRVDTTQGRPVIYIVSQRRPVYQGDVWTIETKDYDPVIFPGQKLAFSLRANPVRTRWTEPGEDGRRVQKRHDVVMDAKRAIRKGNESASATFRMSDLVQVEGVRWLQERGKKNGFTVEGNQVIAGGYRTQSFPQGSKNRMVSISTIDFSGLLTVDDPDPFQSALVKGIGPAKGFGCGMLMVKPP